MFTICKYILLPVGFSTISEVTAKGVVFVEDSTISEVTSIGVESVEDLVLSILEALFRWMVSVPNPEIATTPISKISSPEK